MKIEKVEDLRKLRWRTLTDEEWGILYQYTGFLGKYVKKKEIEQLFEDKYREVARKTFLPIKEVVTFLKEENFAFHENFEKMEGDQYVEQIKMLTNLLKIPEIYDEQSLLQEFEQLTEKEKARFIAEIWKDYIAPELSELMRNE